MLFLRKINRIFERSYFEVLKCHWNLWFICTRKEEGQLLLSSPSYISCPNCFWFNCVSEVLQKSRYIKMQMLCWIESSGTRVCAVHCAQEQSLLCILQGLPPLLSHKCLFLKDSVNVDKKGQLLLGSIFEAPVICRAESDSCRRADSFDLSSASSQRPELIAFSKMKLGLPIVDINQSICCFVSCHQLETWSTCRALDL